MMHKTDLAVLETVAYDYAKRWYGRQKPTSLADVYNRTAPLVFRCATIVAFQKATNRKRKGV